VPDAKGIADVGQLAGFVLKRLAEFPAGNAVK
jgi:hypothetical protein